MRTAALLLTVLTGFTGLVYEVTWQKCLATLLGSHSEATAAVLGIFLGGLAVGYALFGRATARLVERAGREGRPPALLRFYGLVESAIGAHALLFPWLFAGVQALSVRLPQGSTGLGFAFDVGLTVLLIGPPTVLMGGTIPVLTQALARSLADATRVHAFVYAFNTTGAFVGAVAAGLWLLPRLGIENVLRGMGVLNLLVGAVFLWLGRRPQPLGTLAPPATEPAAAPRGFALYAAVAALLGFAMMASQTVLIRIGGLALGASHFTFAMVVGVYVLCIALGSLAVSAAPRVPRWALPVSVWLLAGCLMLLYGRLEDAGYWAHVLRTHFGQGETDFHPFYLTAFGWLWLVLAVPVGLSGASLPLLFDHLRREVGDLGSLAGRLYSWNTLGNLLGALVGGYVLLLWLDLHHVYRVAVGAVLVAGVMLNARVTHLPHVANLALAAALGLTLILLPPWQPKRLSAGLFLERQAGSLTRLGADGFFRSYRPNIQLYFYADDPAVSVAVKGATAPGLQKNRSIVVNGKPDSSTLVDYPTLALAALLPCLLADRCQRSFVIGLGTGVTAGELASLDGMQQVVVAEISRGVIEALPRFEFANRGVVGNPSIRLVRGDAYRALLRSPGRYDVITSEPSNPWVSGVEMLYSREFLDAARSRLSPGGVFAQWFHTYASDDATTQLILRTYLQVFDGVSAWFTSGPDILLLGFTRPEGALDLGRIERRVARPDYAAGLQRAGVDGVPALLAHELLPLGTARELGLAGPVHTLMHPRLSDLAARAFFRGGFSRLPSAAPAAATARRHALLQRWLAGRAGLVTDDERFSIVDQVCRSRKRECLTALAWWQHDDPDSTQLKERVAVAIRGEAPQGLASLTARRKLLSRARSLHGATDADTPVSFDEASRVTALYDERYFAPLPFDPAALRAVWSRCAAADTRCDTGRREAEERFGLGGQQVQGPG